MRLFSVLLALLFCTPAIADTPVTTDNLQGTFSENAYSFATSETQKNGAVFMKLYNGSDDFIALVGARSDVSDHVEIHEMKMDHGVMKMRQIQGIEIPSHGSFALEPKGYHLMLMDLKAPLKKGESFDLELEFHNGHKEDVSVKIVAPGEMLDDHSSHHKH